MPVNYVWSGDDEGLFEDIQITGVQSFETDAPTGDLWSLSRVIANVSVRAHITNLSGAPEYWWVSSEVKVDAVFAPDGVDFTPDVTSGDKLIVFATHLQPVISYHPTAGHTSIVWAQQHEWADIHVKKVSDLVPATRRKVFLHVSALDQHGVFVNATSTTNFHFAIDVSTRVLWYLKT